LCQAILRGVNIEIILPQKTDGGIIDRVNYYYLLKFYPLGIKFYLQKEMLHAKAMVVDEKEGFVGSQNIDLLSFDYLLEMGMFFTNQKMVADLIDLALLTTKDSWQLKCSKERGGRNGKI